MNIPSQEANYWLQIFRWITNPVKYMEDAAKKYGDIFNTNLGGKFNKLIFVSNPQALKQLLSNDSPADKLKPFSASGNLNQIIKPLLGSYSVILLDGLQHRGRRQLLMPSFHGNKVQAYGELICNLTEKVMDNIPLQQTFSARKAMQEISLQVILEAVFGLAEGKKPQKLKALLSSISDLFNSPLTSAFLFFPSWQKNWGFWGYLQKIQAEIDKLLDEEISDRRENINIERNDILSLLMSAKDEQGQPMTDGELRDEVMTLLFAGHETTATAMSWALYWIHHLPEVRTKLLAELATLDSAQDIMSIARLPYLTAVCNETLRIYPVGMLTFPREVIEPVEFMGYQLEAGTILAGCIYLTHRREDIFPEANKFKPERFLERQFSTYEFMPFGGGARRCIGEALALLEMKLVLATILTNYQLVLADSQPEKPQRRGLTLASARGVKMKITDRLQKVSLKPRLLEEVGDIRA